MQTPVLRSIRLADTNYQILFTRLSGHRATTGDSQESVETVTCDILDENLETAAFGRSIKADDDDFSMPKGCALALARALDDAEAYGLFDRDDALRMYGFFVTNYMAANPVNVPSAVLRQTGPDRKHIENVKLLLPYIGAPKLTDEEARIAAVRAARRESGGQGVGTFSGRTPDRMETPRTSVGGAMMGLAPAPKPWTPPRKSTPSPLLLNDRFRRDAERLGISLDTAVGALSMADLSRLYRARMAQNLQNPEVVEARDFLADKIGTDLGVPFTARLGILAYVLDLTADDIGEQRA